MANEKLFRIEWDDELWTEWGPMPVDLVQTVIDGEEHNIDVAGVSQPEALIENPSENVMQYGASDMNPSFHIQKNQETSGKNADNPQEFPYFGYVQNVRSVDLPAASAEGLPYHGSDFVRESPNRASSRSGEPVVRAAEFDGVSLSYVQNPVNLAVVRNADANLNRLQRASPYEPKSEMKSSDYILDVGEGEARAKQGSTPIAMRQTIRQVVEEKLSELKVYVLESDITDAQQAVKTVVKQATF